MMAKRNCSARSAGKSILFSATGAAMKRSEGCWELRGDEDVVTMDVVEKAQEQERSLAKKCLASDTQTLDYFGSQYTIGRTVPYFTDGDSFCRLSVTRDPATVKFTLLRPDSVTVAR
jgi:hypothetical protein